MTLAYHNPRDITLSGRIISVSKTMLFVTGMLFFSATQAATQHIVESGETINEIALRYDITQTALIDANGLQAMDVEIGQLLTIPDKNQPHNLYKVELGDSLSSLATKYKVNKNELARINNLSPEAGLLINSILIIPSSSNERVTQKIVAKKKDATSDNRQNITVTSKSASSAQTKSNTTTTKEGERYRVKYGDSLSKVAQLYDVDVNALAKINNMNVKDSLYFGRYITIPTTATATATYSPAVSNNTVAATAINMQYAVQSGDTLMGIANKFKSDFREIARLSGIDYNDSLVIGQILTIPSKSKSK